MTRRRDVKTNRGGGDSNKNIKNRRYLGAYTKSII